MIDTINISDLLATVDLKFVSACATAGLTTGWAITEHWLRRRQTKRLRNRITTLELEITSIRPEPTTYSRQYAQSLAMDALTARLNRHFDSAAALYARAASVEASLNDASPELIENWKRQEHFCKAYCELLEKAT